MIQKQALPPTWKGIFVFWLPLALTWLLMAVEGPFLSAVIARLSDIKPNLAAFGVSFSLAIIIEAPIIMMMTASTALVDSGVSLRRLFRYTLLLNAIITFLMGILIIPPVFFFLAEDVIRLPSEVSHLSYWATVLFLPWPAAIGFRRFYQGLLIRNQQTRRVAYGTALRLGSVLVVALLLYHQGDIPGAWVGAAALSCAVIVEAIASRLMAGSALRRFRQISDGQQISYGEIHRFYLPLALTSILTLAAHPIATFFLGQSRMSLESLALMPVLNSLVFIFRSVGLSYQEVVIAKVGTRFEGYRPVRDFAVLLGVVVVGVLGLVAFTPLLDLWYQQVSGLSPDMAAFGEMPTRLLFIIPGFTVWISFQRGLQVVGRQTRPVTVATAVELIGIVAFLLIGIQLLDLVGAVAAAVAFLVGRLAANLFLIPANRRVICRLATCSESDPWPRIGTVRR